MVADPGNGMLTAVAGPDLAAHAIEHACATAVAGSVGHLDAFDRRSDKISERFLCWRDASLLAGSADAIGSNQVLECPGRLVPALCWAVFWNTRGDLLTHYVDDHYQRRSPVD